MTEVTELQNKLKQINDVINSQFDNINEFNKELQDRMQDLIKFVDDGIDQRNNNKFKMVKVLNNWDNEHQNISLDLMLEGLLKVVTNGRVLFFHYINGIRPFTYPDMGIAMKDTNDSLPGDKNDIEFFFTDNDWNLIFVELKKRKISVLMT